MVQFYKNKKQNFECSVKITGTNPDSATARLILIPEDDSKRIFFEGKIKDNKCLIEIYPNININPKGKAMLEIIVDDSVIFSPWESVYELISEEVKIESTNITKNTTSGVSVQLLDDAKVNKQPVVKSLPKVEPVVEKKVVPKDTINMDELYKALLEQIGDGKKPLKEQLIWEVNKIINRNKGEHRNTIEAYKKTISFLDENTLRELFKIVKNEYKPTPQALNIAKSLNIKESTLTGKFLMYLTELNRARGKK